ncbi:ATP-binding protein [Cytophagaceae bacterium ABcell3]|nr:ATP-binding protein [Cytophagaceae bacterium ABcell3]
MFFNSKVLAFLIALGATLSFIFFLSIFPGLLQESVWLLVVTFLLSFISAFLVLKYVIFREIEKIHSLLENIQRKEYDLDIGANIKDDNPLGLLKKEIAEFAETKQKEINELKKLETFRREFLADVSHELKTPIFAAQGFVHTLLDGAVEDLSVRDNFLNKAVRSLDGLNILVEDLITISQLESGDIKMNFTHFDIHKLTEEVYDQLEDTAMKRGTKLKFYKFSPKSCYVYADKNRIRQVLTNLIVNAVKYGKDKGTVSVSFAVENKNVYTSVKDNGPGIEQYHLNRIFERFYRVDKSRSREKGGTGLGLAIVKHILEAHDSRIYVSSKVGEGSIFSFKLKKGKVINQERDEDDEKD